MRHGRGTRNESPNLLCRHRLEHKRFPLTLGLEAG